MKPDIRGLQGNIEVLEEMGKYAVFQKALDRLFGVTHEVKIVRDSRGFQRVVQGAVFPETGPAFESIEEAFCAFTGEPNASRFDRIRQIYNGNTFVSALGTTLNKLLLKDYPLGEYHWRDLVAQIDTVENFRPQDAIRLGSFGDLPEVEEDDPYGELTAHADEKVSFSVKTYGGLFPVTRRAVVGNDVAGIQRGIEQLRRAAWRTLGKAIWQKLISNGTYDVDGQPLFSEAHGNLGSGALSIAALNAARAAIFSQKEPDGDDRMGLSGPFMLAIPVELEPTAMAIGLCDQVGAAANPWKGRFGANAERVFSNPLMIDADDWILLDVSGNAGVIEIGFLNGKQEPQILLADSPREGQALSQDRVVYKFRAEWGLTIADYRGAYKSVVGS